MGYHKGQGGRRCAVCLGWYAVQAMVRLGLRYYCPRDAVWVRMRRRVVSRRRGVAGSA